jgi:TRAP-type C4-dicarboxylate transport system substrate-binding protein
MIFSSHMRGHSGLIFTLSAALLLMVLSSTVDAVTLKIATLAPDGTSWMKQMRKGAAEISGRTDGRVKIKIYPGGVMGNTNTVLQKMRIGQLQGAAFTGSSLSQVHPDAQLYT